MKFRAVSFNKPNGFGKTAIPQDRMLKLRAWAVHFYTSLGLVMSLMALLAVLEGSARNTFLWLGLALLIDGTDGILARRCAVGRWTPNFDGRKLDDIIDYLTYVLIPIFFAFRFSLVSVEWTPVLAFALMASAYGFCSKAAKTNDGFFTGFPSYWNVLVFYLYLLQTPALFNQIVFLILAIMVFIPIKYLYPTQAPSHRTLNMAFALVWGLALCPVLLNFDHPPMTLLYASMIYPVYYMLMSFYLHFKPYFK